MTAEITFDRGETAVITTDPGVCEAIANVLAKKEYSGVIRIVLTSTGCCDASLGLLLDEVGESDLVEEIGDLTFVMSRKIYDLAGRVRISCRENAEFVLTSEKPVSEWAGFGACTIKT